MNKKRISLLVPDWPAPKNVLACTTLRGEEINEDEYSNFNLALHVADAKENVTKNRRLLKENLALQSEPVWLEQVHGVNCVDLSKLNESAPIADASFSLKQNQVCTIMTADCLPLLVTDMQGRGVAAIHAGWRGLLEGIIEKSLQKFCHSVGIEANECLVWLGPAISQKHFEVGSDVYKAFMQRFRARRTESSSKQALNVDEDLVATFIEHAGKRDKYFCDLYQLARLELQSLGVTDIYGGDQCTYEQEEQYYSYRRTSHQGHENCGRMASLIWMV